MPEEYDEVIELERRIAGRPEEDDQIQEIAEDGGLTDEGKAWMALGLHAAGKLPELRKRLLDQIAGPVGNSPFNATTFSSMKRREAVCLLAHCEINYVNWSAGKRETQKKRLEGMIQSSTSLSTQENLWLLMLLDSMTRKEFGPTLKADTVTPKPALSSANSRSVGWMNVPLSDIGKRFPAPLKPAIKGSFMLRATYPASEEDTGLSSKGLKLTRTTRLLSPAGSRNGSEGAPWKLGDHVLVTFTIEAGQPLDYVELEDLIPACFETVNPDLPAIREHFDLPIELGVKTLELSHSEFRNDRTLLYFEKSPEGRNLYGVLARVTTPGVFRWPRTQVRPMYDSRFGAVSEGAVVHVVK